MGSIGRYVSRAVLDAFAIAYLSLPVVRWLMGAVRSSVLITIHRQVVFVWSASRDYRFGPRLKALPILPQQLANVSPMPQHGEGA